MSEEGFVVDPTYQGYVFLGWAKGQFEQENGKGKRPYFNMYVFSPVSDWRSEDYEAFGLKAEKLSCVSPDVWEGFSPGDKVNLFFTKKGQVKAAALEEP